MAAHTPYRTFTESEQEQRDAWIAERIEHYCTGCLAILGTDGYVAWRPDEHCAVHGAETDEWWAELNRELDARWPGTWH
jgi:hypothetical protein